MNNQNFRSLALIGAGQWGKNIARICNDLGVLHTICDSNELTLDNYQKLYPIVHMTSNFQRVIDNPHIDKIMIATPAHTHFNLAKIALDAGKDVFVEKPLCLDPNEGKILIDLAASKGCILMVGHLYHYHPAFIALKKLIKNGDIGELKYIAAHRLKLGKFRQEENVLWSFSPHDISVILSLAENSKLIELECNGTAFITEGIHDIVTTTMKFSNGLKAHLFASWIHPYKEQKIIAVGTKGMIVLDDTKSLNEKLAIYQEVIELSPNNIPIAKEGKVRYVELFNTEPLQEECAHFLECCLSRQNPTTDGYEGVKVLEILALCQNQLQSKNVSPNYFAHETAIIEKGASIGENTKIWHFSNIKSGSNIGKNCNLGQNVVVFSDSQLGNNCKVQNNVSIFSGVICEDDVFLGPSMVFTNVINPRSSVCRRGEYKKTFVRRGVTIGANATIVCGIELGEYSFVGAGAVVTKSTKPFALMVGNPAKQIGWMSRHGEKLNLPQFSKEPIEAFCPVTGEKYVLFGDKLLLNCDLEVLF